jgi:hypothetical protein
VPAAITPETATFWAAGNRGELTVEECPGCGLHVFPPRGVCRRCYRRDLRLRPISGPGTVYSHTVNHNAWGPDAPAVYTVVLVEFPGYSGVRFVGLFDDPAGPPRIGDQVGFTLVPAFDERFQISFHRWSAS